MFGISGLGFFIATILLLPLLLKANREVDKRTKQEPSDEWTITIR